MAILSELSDNLGDSSKVTISKVVEEVKKNYSSQADTNAIIGEKTGEQEDMFPGKITYNIPASGISEAIVIEVDENLQIKGNTTASGGNIVNPTPTENGASSDYTKIGNVYCNSPDLSGFNPNCTYYVTYDSSGTQTSENTPISQSAPNGWYDYSSNSKKWANVVTKNNGNVTYWVWIPRFKYVTNSDKTTTARFVDMNDKCYMDVNDVKTEIDVSTYDISDAFTFNGKQLPGYWVAKYRIQEGTDDGTTIASMNSVNQIEVDLSGFNPDNTYYVEYDNSGNEINADDITKKTKIQLNSNGKATNIPVNWYDYSQKKWANVVTSKNGLTTYWTYIPRYEYQNWKYYQKNSIKFINPLVTDSNADGGYSVPDSFTFNGQELKGYWVTKYRIQDSPAGTPVFKDANGNDVNGTYYK